MVKKKAKKRGKKKTILGRPCSGCQKRSSPVYADWDDPQKAWCFDCGRPETKVSPKKPKKKRKKVRR